MAFLIPTGLQAKDLVEFCLMEMSSQQTAQTSTSDSSHHCDTEPAEEQDEHPNCDWGFICACNISESALSDEEWVPKSKDVAVLLTEQENHVPFYSSDELIRFGEQEYTTYTSPPLYLLYDTLLM